jgi:hypothetical protein
MADVFDVHKEEALRGEQRERRQLQAWLVAGATDLLTPMGLANGWWCALEMLRSEVFADGTSGDVDLLAGPLELDIGDEEWHERVESARRVSDERLAVPLAMAALESEGRVKWPPDVSYTVAVEVKASYYVDGWRATHVGEATKILGSLRQRKRYGINCVSLLHLGVLEPADSVDAMEERARCAAALPEIAAARRFGEFGYATGTMASVADSGELPWGEMNGLRWMNYPRPSTKTAEQSWHDGLRQRFAEMPVPRSYRTYIHRCPYCCTWMHAGSASTDGFACSSCGEPKGSVTWTAEGLSVEAGLRIRRAAGLASG